MQAGRPHTKIDAFILLVHVEFFSALSACSARKGFETVSYSAHSPRNPNALGLNLLPLTLQVPAQSDSKTRNHVFIEGATSQPFNSQNNVPLYLKALPATLQGYVLREFAQTFALTLLAITLLMLVILAYGLVNELNTFGISIASAPALAIHPAESLRHDLARRP